MEKTLMQQYSEWLTEIANNLEADDDGMSGLVRDHPDLAIVDDKTAASLSDGDRKLYTKKEVQAAIERLENGLFGLCEACGEPIAEDRLDVIPYARYCSSCGARLDPIMTGAYESSETPGSTSAENNQPMTIESEPDNFPPQLPEPK
ncbi:MAG: TraR/DksA family transcriptional regulator [Planctomycetaceae bacterium]